MQKRIAVTLIVLFLLPMINAEQKIADESRTATGGHAILLEQYTATWCDTCATIDPWVVEFTDSHSSRMVRVALHPDDHDPFGSALTTKRVTQKQANQSVSLPAFWFDGKGFLEGAVSPSLLENGLRSAEGNRIDWIGMRVWWDTWENSPHDDAHEFHVNFDENLPPEAIITVFRLETLEMTSEIANNGVDVHHDVATQMISFSPNGTVIDSFDASHGWNLSTGDLPSEDGVPVYTLKTYGEVDGFVTIVELNGGVRGVIGISDDINLPKTEKYEFLAIVLLVLALVCSTVVVRRD